MIAETITRLVPSGAFVHVLDAGCGVGGTLLALADNLPGRLRGVGISISGSQVRRARQRARAAGDESACMFLEASYLDVPCRAAFDAAIMVESLIHSPDPRRTIAQLAAALRPGGVLLICDDFLTLQQAETAESRRSLTVFRRGWLAHGLHSTEDIQALASESGLQLIERRDFTPQLRLRRFPAPITNGLLRLSAVVPASWAVTQGLFGGLALQHCLANGTIGYHWLMFRKTSLL